MRRARGLPKQMNHQIISVFIGVVIIAAVVGGVVYVDWPHMRPREERPSASSSATTRASTSTVDLIKTATTSILESLPRATVGPPPAAAVPTIRWTPAAVSQIISPGETK